MPPNKVTSIIVSCTPKQAQKIRQAAKAERRTLSGFVLNAVFEKLPPEVPAEDIFDEEKAKELAQVRAELRLLLMDGTDLRQVFRLAYQVYGEHSAICSARARRRIARAQERLLKVAQRRERFSLQVPVAETPVHQAKLNATFADLSE